MRRWLLIGLGIIFIAILGWYYLKPYDYQVNLTVPAIPGTVEQSLLTWSETQDSSTVSILNGSLQQRFKVGERTYIYSWELKGTNDNTDISVFVHDPQYTFKDRLALLFEESRLESDSKSVVKDYLSFLQAHLSRFRVRIVGADSLPAKFCACVETKTSQRGKAWGMMKNYPLLNGVLGDAGVELDGRPFLQIREWNKIGQQLVYDFCYPIKKQDSLPQHPEIYYREFEQQAALKAVYNGNYITSDRAWYHLLREAREQGLPNTGLPVEVFFNNPNMGGNELQWTAEIYLPLEKR